MIFESTYTPQNDLVTEATERNPEVTEKGLGI
jgi:hypothetical protein